MHIDALSRRLIDRYQHGMPLCAEPYRAMAEELGCSEDEVLACLGQLQEGGGLSRIGPVFEHSRAGASTLVALAVPEARLEHVAARINAFPRSITTTCASIATTSGSSLPGRTARISTACSPRSRRTPALCRSICRCSRPSVSTWASRWETSDERLSRRTTGIAAAAPAGNRVAAGGRPYRQLAEQIGCSEQQVLEQVEQWQQVGLFRRVGLVLKHRALGFRANAMLVMDIPDEQVDEVGRRLGQAAGVNLCYQRPRRLPQWPYNLFCMVHGREREQVCQLIEQLLAEHGLSGVPHQLLFSTRAFKQCGGRFAPPPREVAHG